MDYINYLDNVTVDADYDFTKLYEEFKQSLYRTGDPVTVILIVGYSVGFVLALLGNLMVLLVILSNRNMRTSNTNSYLLNLAVADLLVSLVCIPLTVGETVYKAWIYGYFLCKAKNYLQGLCISASVLTIMALSIDRYMAIRHPVRARSTAAAPCVQVTITGIWAVSAIIMVPLAIVPSLTSHPLGRNESVALCGERWPPGMSRTAFDVFLFIFIYMVPGSVVIFSYSLTGCRLMTPDSLLQRNTSDTSCGAKMLAGRRRLARMLLVLAILFAVSWMPYHAVNLYIDFNSDRESETLLYLLSLALLLGHSHSAQNPVLYCVMSQKFRKGMTDMIRCAPQQNTHTQLIRVESLRLRRRSDIPTPCVVTRNRPASTQAYL